MATAKRLPSGNWRVNVYIGKDENGKRKYKSFTDPDKRRAEKAAAEYAYLHRQIYTTLTFNKAANEYIAKKSKTLSPTTVNEYRKALNCYFADFGNITVDKITNDIMQNFVNTLADRLAPKTVRNIYGFTTAVIYSQLPNVRFNVDLPKKVKQFKDLPTPEAVFAAVKGTRVELPVLLAMWLGLRMSEIRGLRHSDYVNGVITLQQSMVKVNNVDVVKSTMKTYDSARRLAVPEYIAALIDGNPHDGEYIVPLSYPQIYKGFSKALKAANIPHIAFHDLRHLNASVMLRLGVPDKYAMERGGWSSTNILKSVYQNTFSDTRREVDKMIDNYFTNIITS